MSAFNDARCDNCGRRFGWQGELADRPKCPGCGQRPSQATLEAVQAKMDAAEARILEGLKDEDK